jgi:hypothetical protein
LEGMIITKISDKSPLAHDKRLELIKLSRESDAPPVQQNRDLRNLGVVGILAA